MGLANLISEANYRTQREFARQIKVSEPQLSRMIRAETLSEENVRRILVALCSEAPNNFSYQYVWQTLQADYNFEPNFVGNISNWIRDLDSNSGASVRHNLPPRDLAAEQFIGRLKELELLKAALIKRNSRYSGEKKIIVDGIGGVGKTTLVLEVAYQCLESPEESGLPHYDVIIYASAKLTKIYDGMAVEAVNPDLNLSRILIKISEVLEDERIRQSDNVDDQITTACQILRDYNTLLIIDNLETIQSKRDLARLLSSLPATVTVLITTRLTNNPSLFERIEIGSLAREDALNLITVLLENRSRILSDEEKESIYEVTDGIPLAIEYAIAVYLQRNDIQRTCAIFSEEGLYREGNDVAKFIFSEIFKSAPTIPQRLLMAAAILENPCIDDAIVRISGLETEDSGAIYSGFDHLNEVCFIRGSDQREINTNFRAYEMLSLTRRYARAELRGHPEFKDAAVQRWINYYVRFAEEYGRHDQSGNWSERFDVLETQWSNLESVINFCAGKDRYYNEFKLIWKFLHSFTETYGHWSEHFSWLRTLTIEAERKADTETEVFAKSAIARVHLRAGTPQNLTEAEELLDSVWKKLRPLDSAWNELNANIELPIWVELYENTIMFHIESKSLGTATKYIDDLEEFVNSNVEESNSKIRYLLPVKYRRGIVFERQSYHDQAKEQFRQAIRDAKNLHWVRAWIAPQNRLADLLIKDGRQESYQEAATLLDEVLSATRHNKYHRRTAYCLLSLAYLHKQLGQRNEAKAFAERALGIFRRFGIDTKKTEAQRMLNSLS